MKSLESNSTSESSTLTLPVCRSLDGSGKLTLSAESYPIQFF